MENQELKINVDLVSNESLDQMLKAMELKYIENIIEVAEEQKLVDDNIKDFEALDEAIQKKAIEEFPKAQADQDYFEKKGADKSLAKPMMILSNIENKKNEVKIKSWKVEYFARVIGKVKEFQSFKTLSDENKK